MSTHNFAISENTRHTYPPAALFRAAHANSIRQPLVRLALVVGLILVGLSGGRLEVAASGLPSKPLATGYDCTEAGLDAAIAAGGTATFTIAPCAIGLTGSKTIGKDLTIDGGTYGGYGLGLYSDGLRAFTVNSGVHFTLKNAAIFNATTTDSFGGSAILNNGGSVTIDHDQFVKNAAKTGGALRVINSGSLNVTNSTFSYNTATGGYGGAIGIEDGSAMVISSTFTANTSSAAGGAVSSSSAVTITGGIFINNSAPTGGAVLGFTNARLRVQNTTFTVNHATAGVGGGVYTNDALDVTSSTFISNTATGDGGSIFGDPNSRLTIADSLLQANTADHYGGGIASNGPVTITQSTFISNTSQLGGGVSMNIITTLRITGSTFTGNHATDLYGGAICAVGPLTVTNGTFTGNTAKGSGGAIFQNPPLPMDLESTTFTGNHSDADGGAIAAQGPLTVKHSTFTANTAQHNGGGIIALVEASPINITDSTFLTNTAQKGSGLYSNGPMTLTTSSLINNTANQDGGALYIESGSGTATIVNTTIAKSTGSGIVNSGGGIQVVNSTIAGNDKAIYALTATVHLKNSIVSGDCVSAGSITSQGYNLGTSSTCGLTQASDRVLDAAALKLGVLVTAGNGTSVYPLPGDSPARDTADLASCPRSDQRGTARPQGSGCDIGAYEATAGVILTPATITLNGVPHQTVTAPLTLTNVGPAAADAYTIITLSELGWSATVQPSTTSPLAVGGSITLTVRVTIPADAQPGQTSTVTVTATSQTYPGQMATVQITTGVLGVQSAIPVAMRSAASGW